MCGTCLTRVLDGDPDDRFVADLAILDAQQRNLLAYPERSLGLNIDAGGVQARGVIDRVVAAERAAATAAPATP